MRLYDAHAHLPDYENKDFRPSDPAASDSPGQRYSIINGTSPADWPKVIEFAQRYPRALPAIGLHPQNVQQAPEDWKGTFLQFLAENSMYAVGEIGLDRRYQNDRFETQLDAFSWQLRQAGDRNLPVSIHCVKAIGVLMETLRTHNLPPCSIHLHAYAGPVELIPELVEMGGYFSFAAGQLESDSIKVRDRIRTIPTDRLLIETDKTYKHDSLELYNCYAAIAKIRDTSLDKLVTLIEENFKTYFLSR